MYDWENNNQCCLDLLKIQLNWKRFFILKQNLKINRYFEDIDKHHLGLCHLIESEIFTLLIKDINSFDLLLVFNKNASMIFPLSPLYGYVLRVLDFDHFVKPHYAG